MSQVLVVDLTPSFRFIGTAGQAVVLNTEAYLVAGLTASAQACQPHGEPPPGVVGAALSRLSRTGPLGDP